MLASIASATNPSSSNPFPQRSFWRGIWMQCVPHKVKHFAWRACNYFLPTMDNLFRRHIVPSELCSQCKVQPKILCMWCRVVRRLKVYGGILVGFGTWLIPLLGTSLTLFQGFCRLLMNTGPSISSLWLGCCGIGVIQPASIALLNHWRTLQEQHEIFFRTS